MSTIINDRAVHTAPFPTNSAMSRSNVVVEAPNAQDSEDEEDEMKTSEPVPSHSAANFARHQWSTRRSGRQSEEHELTEMAAPAPADTEEQESRRPDLEEGEEEAYRQEAQEPIPGQQNENLTTLYTISYLIFFSFWGTLARLGTQWLGFYPGAPVVISNLWANFGGCVLMGFLSENRNLFTGQRPSKSLKTVFRRGKQQLSSSASCHSTDSTTQGESSSTSKQPPRAAINKKKIPLFVGLTTGFCGSFTSFSTFSRDMFFALSNQVATPRSHPGDTASQSSYAHRNPGWSVNALLAVIILTVCVNMAALQLGAHIALLADHILHPIPFRLFRKYLDPIFVFLALGCWIGAVLLAALPPDRPGGPAAHGRISWSSEAWRGEVLFALVFAPLGCLLRWYLSSHLNGRIPSFPLGTFIANISGVAILAMCYDIQHSKAGATATSAIGGQVGCQVLQGVEDGFCGCLTTVSTWMLELKTLRRRHAYFYGGASVLVALVTVVLLMGSVYWSVGYVEAACQAEVS